MASYRSKVTICVALLLVIGFCFAFEPATAKDCKSDDECACLHGRGACITNFCQCVDIKKECDKREDCAAICKNPEEPYCGHCYQNICLCEYC